MKTICHTVVCFIFLTLHDGNTGHVSGGISNYRRMEGENITVNCTFPYSGTKKFFCKGKCEKPNILIATTKNAAKNGRYSIQYVKKGPLSSDILHVSITQLKKSDTGRYTCLSETWRGVLSYEFYIDVTGAPTTTTTTESSAFSSESVEVSSVSSETSKQPEISPESSATAGMLPYVGLFLAIMIIFFSATLLIFCKKKRASKHKGPHSENESGDITQANQLYENIRKKDNLPPTGVSSAHTYPKYSQSHGFENMNFYSPNTAPQNKAEDDSSNLDYSEVDFSHMPVTNSAPHRNATDVVYSTPVVHNSPSSHTKDASSPLYSAVKKQY